MELLVDLLDFFLVAGLFFIININTVNTCPTQLRPARFCIFAEENKYMRKIPTNAEKFQYMLITGFRCDVNEIYPLLGSYAAYKSDNSLPAFWDNYRFQLQGSSSRYCLILNHGTETSVQNYQSFKLFKIPEERRSHADKLGRSLNHHKPRRFSNPYTL
jgi:hypothetical protein